MPKARAQNWRCSASKPPSPDRNSDSGVLHRVRVGPYATVETMNKARAKLLDSGVDVAIGPQPKNNLSTQLEQA